MKKTSGNNAAQSQSSATRAMLTGNACILGAIILFALNIPVVKILIPRWMSADDVTLVRIAGGAALFWLASFFVKKDAISKTDFAKVFLGGGLSLFLFFYLLNVALKYGNPIDISIIMTLPPVYVIVYQSIFRHYKPSWLEVAGMLVAFAGAVLVIVSGQQTKQAPDPLLGDLLAVVCGVAYMAYLLILEGPTHKYKPIPLLKWVFLGACIPCLAICWGVADVPIVHAGSDASPWLWVAFLAIGPSFLGYLLINPAIKLIGSELVAIYQYFMPVATAIVAVLLGEAQFQWVEGAAIVVIIAGMFLTDYAKRKRKKE